MNSEHSDSLPDFDALWDYYQPAETAAKFYAILNVAENSGDANYLAELRTQIARALGLQQRFDEAHALLDLVEAIVEDGAGSALTLRSGSSTVVSPSRIPWLRVEVRYRLERGRVFNSAKQKDKAISHFEQAWNVAVEAGLDFYAVDAAHMMAIAVSADQALVWNQKALALAEKSAEPKARRWRGSLYNNIGWHHFGQNDFNNALAMFEKAVRARVGQEQPVEVRFAKWCVAKTLRMMGQVDSALVIQRMLEMECHDSDEGDDGFVFEEMAECLLLQGNNKEAAQYFVRAYELLSDDVWLKRDEPERLARLKLLGGLV